MLRSLILAAKLSLALAIFGIIVVIAIIWHFSQDLPDYSQLKEYHPQTPEKAVGQVVKYRFVFKQQA